MRSLVSVIVAAAVTLHALLGCCWHHAHEAEAADGHDASAHEHVALADELADGVSHACRHEHDDHDHCPSHESAATGFAADDHEHSGPCPDSCPGTCSDKCFVVTTARVSFETSPSVLPWSIAPEPQGATHHDGVSADFAARDATTYPPPTRLHLLYRLLLI